MNSIDPLLLILRILLRSLSKYMHWTIGSVAPYWATRGGPEGRIIDIIYLDPSLDTTKNRHFRITIQEM